MTVMSQIRTKQTSSNGSHFSAVLSKAIGRGKTLTSGLFFLAVLLNVTLSATAATFYVRQGATGNASGTDWNNAFTQLPRPLQRGSVYLLADGNYPAYTFSDPQQGTNRIVIRKATIADHGTDAGWSDTYGDGQAVFRASLTFSSSYYTLDGVSRTSWKTGHGIKVSNFPGAITSGGVVRLSAPSITFRYVEIEGSHSVDDTYNEDGVYAISADAFTFQFCAIYDTGRCAFLIRDSENSLIDQCYLARNDSSSALHSEGISASDNVNNFTVRNSLWEDMEGTAFIATPNGSHHRISNWYIYGNVFMYTEQNRSRPSASIRNGVANGVISVFDCDVSGDFFIYNNTSININASAAGSGGWNNAGVWFDENWPTTAQRFYVKNNLWLNCEDFSALSPRSDITDLQWSHNLYANTAVTDADPNKIVAQTDPLRNWNAGDFHLKAPTVTGLQLHSQFGTDPDGVLRGADGVWDRGAFEFGSTPDSTPPKLSIIQTSGITSSKAVVSWTTDELSSSLVEYGRTTSYGSSVFDETRKTSQSFELNNLESETTYHFRVHSKDAAGNETVSTNLTFVTRPVDLTPPLVQVIAPANGAVLSNLVALTASASDSGSGLARVEFLVDDTVIAAIQSSPYTANWQSATVSNGAHTILARAFDNDGNESTSTPLSVTVKNDTIPLNAGLSAHWTFDTEFNGVSLDTSGNNNAATLIGGAALSAGKYSTALLLDNINEYASVPHSQTLQLSNAFSITLWVKHSALPAAGQFSFYLEKGRDDHDNFAVGVNDAQRTFIEFEDTTGSYNYFSASSRPIPLGAWTHVAVVIDPRAQLINFYIDGQNAGQFTNQKQFDSSSTDPLLIGRQNFGALTHPMQGLVDDLRIYNRALTASDIAYLYQAAPPSAPVNLQLAP
jgi:hypothetical protein